MIEIDKKVFRGNDIRGKVNIDITDEFAYVIGLAFGSYIKENNRSKCVVDMIIVHLALLFVKI